MDQKEMDAAWDQIAPGYDEFVTPSHVSLGNEGISRSGVGKGTRFLDVACGSGALSIPAARAGAKVTAVDISPTMVERLKARAREQHLEIEARTMDGHQLEFADNSFDVTGSQFGVMLFPDLPRGLKEMVRVTKPGGKVLMTVFGSPMQIEFFGFFLAAMKSVVPNFEGPPMDPPPLPFQVSDPAVFRRRLEEAGLKDIQIDTLTEKLEFKSGKHLWDWLLGSNPIATIITSGLDKDQAAAVQKAMDTMIRAREGNGSAAVLTNPIHIGVGSK